MSFRKGQAALDFLMTYGWAIALVVIIAAVLFALGIFDVSNFVGSKAAGFSGVAVKGWKLTPAGVFTLKLTNEVGQPITIDSINVTIGQNHTDTWAAGVGVIPSAQVGSGADYPSAGADQITSATSLPPQTAGTGYTAKVTITYTDTNSGFEYTSSGTLTGKSTE